MALERTLSIIKPDATRRNVTGAIVDRFAQIEPKVLFAVDGYTYGGKAFDRRDVVRTILEKMPTVTTVIFISYLDPAATFAVSVSSEWDP